MQTDAVSTLVVGAGIVGRACACALARDGHAVVLFDAPSRVMSASYGNAGHLATEQVEPLASPRVLRSAPSRLFLRGGPLDFCSADLGTWLPWVGRYLARCTSRRAAAGRNALRMLLRQAVPAWRRLAAAVGRPELIVEGGHLVVWERAATAEAGRAAWAAADTGTARFEAVDRSRLERLNGALARPVVDGIAFRDTGQVAAPGALLDALQAGFVAAGGEHRTGTVVRLEAGVSQPQAVLDDGAVLRAERIVVAAGVESGRLMRSAGHGAPVIAERGYHIEATTDAWPDLPPVVFDDRSLIVTRFGHRLRVASYTEFGRAATPPDRRKWQRLRRHAAELGLPMQSSVTEWMGARPTLPDYLPAIGTSRRIRNLVYAFGHQHLGLTLAATTAELVRDLVAGRPASLDLAPYDLARFERWAA